MPWHTSGGPHLTQLSPLVLGLLILELTVPGDGTAQSRSPWQEAPPLPRAVTNNAVVGASTEGGPAVFSFLGLDRTREWDGVTSWAFRWNVGDASWTEVAPVPGPGRLAPTAQALDGKIYLFGGYTVAADGSEKSVPHVDVYDPDEDRWTRAAPMPTPVDDAVSGAWADSLIYLVSGWHDGDNVDLVQIFNPATDQWRQATPIPGAPVFGHGGALADGAIVYLGGAHTRGESPRFRLEESAWLGAVDRDDPSAVRWTRLEPPPGPYLYRPAAGAFDGWILFAGGTDNPYNYDGIGYDGVPAQPRARVFGYRVADGGWHTLAPLPRASMDHRTLAVVDGWLVLAGGMLADQTVTDRVLVARLGELVPK